MKYFPHSTESHKSNRDLEQIQIKLNTRLTVVLWAVLLQPPTLGVFCLGQTDLLVAEVEGLLAPLPMQLQDGNEVPNGSDDGEAQDRVNMDPWVLPCAVGEALILQHTDPWRSISPRVFRSLTKEVSVAGTSTDVDDEEDSNWNSDEQRSVKETHIENICDQTSQLCSEMFLW